MTILDPSAADVKALDDVQLRQLVARLATAELRAMGRPETGVLDGGDQRASDGGVDVFVEGSGASAGLMPVLPLGFQVKATPMRRAAILKEMRPQGTLRPAIIDLARKGGGYVLAVGRDDLSASALAVARDAVREGLADEADLHTDVYDAGRLARWAAQFPGVSAWLRAQAGRPVSGWSCIGPWSTPIEGASPYLIDPAARVREGAGNAAAMSVEDGIAAVRRVLGQPGSAVRLVGLSGMGKTRLAEALFDPLIGEPLPSDWAVYADVGASPSVAPTAMADQVVLSGRRAILVIDNCPAETHHNLTRLIGRAGSPVSLLTIDFDVGDKQPDNTTIFRLEPAADSLIDALLRQRKPELTSSQRDRIADFSEGNSRIALALARSIAVSETVTALTDEGLLDRLFLNDRRAADVDLRVAARVASLVYAFEISTPLPSSEAAWLGGLAGLSPMAFVIKIGELLDRGLAQQRGIQRAVMPQAIAAWLAQEALARLPVDLVYEHMVDKAPPRLQRSFVRRLALLAASAETKSLATLLLAPDGPYGSPQDIYGKGLDVVLDLCRLAPVPALDLARRLVSDEAASGAPMTEPLRRHLVDLLHALAHEAEHFEAALEVLADVVSGDARCKSDGMADRLLQFFQLSWAGTSADNYRRAALIDTWLSSVDPGRRALGLKALATALEVQPRYVFPRVAPDGSISGQTPTFATYGDMADWIDARLRRLVSVVQANREDGSRELFLRRFPALAGRPLFQDSVLRAFNELEPLLDRRYTWIAACRALHRARPEGRTGALRALEERLRPRTLKERFEVWVVSDPTAWEDPEGGDRNGWDAGREEAETVGRDAAASIQGEPLLIRAVHDTRINGFGFGAGYASAQSDPEAGWRRLIATSRTAKVIGWRTLAGYIDFTRKAGSVQVEAWLDAMISDPQLVGAGFMIAASQPRHRDGDLSRMLDVLRKHAKADWLGNAWWIRPADDASEILIAEIVEALIDLGHGEQAIRILERRLSEKATPWGGALKSAGRRLLVQLTQSAGDLEMRDARLASLITQALDPNDQAIAAQVLEFIRTQALAPDARFGMMGQTMAVLSNRYPDLVLDTLMLPSADEISRYRIDSLFRPYFVDDFGENPLYGVPIAVLMDWTWRDLSTRPALLARVVPFYKENELGAPSWTATVLALFDLTDDPVMLDTIGDRLFSGGGEGSIVNRFQARRPMLENLLTHHRKGIRAWAAKELPRLDTWLSNLEAEELARDQRFEP